jgi:hypothetical protein
MNTAAVIHDLDEVASTSGDFDVDTLAAGIDGVLQQLLDDAGRPLDDFSGGNLIDERGG